MVVQAHLADVEMELKFATEQARSRVGFARFLIHKLHGNLAIEIDEDEEWRLFLINQREIAERTKKYRVPVVEEKVQERPYLMVTVVQASSPKEAKAKFAAKELDTLHPYNEVITFAEDLIETLKSV